jgi:hypothetical protein
LPAAFLDYELSMWNFKNLVCSKSGLEVYNLLTVKRQLRKGDFNSSPSPKDQQEEDTNKNNWKKKSYR